MRQLYSLFLTVTALVTWPYWLIQGIRKGKYLRTLPLRLGIGLPEKRFASQPLWIHAVSVGEVLVAKALVTAVRKERPNLPVIVSTVTVTGQNLARRELSQADAVFYFPLDWAFCVRRLLRHWRPRCVVLLETEIWPNFLFMCATGRIPVLLLNGRISDRSFGRYRRFRRWLRPLFRRIELIAAQSPEDRRRFLEIGAAQEQVRVGGNMKFDFELPPIDPSAELLRRMRTALASGPASPVIVAGSTMPGEEPLLVRAFREVLEQIPGARMILAPRRPERFEEVARILEAGGVDFLRRSELADENPRKTRMILLDSIGELRAVYSLADVALIGGSFVNFGGHNPLEPAALGKAIVFGPDMSNFKEIARLFVREQAARQCAAEGLPAALLDLLQNSRARDMMGRRAAQTLHRNQGATSHTLGLLLPYLP